MRKITINKGELIIRQNVIGFFQKPVTSFGNGAKIDCPKEFLGRNVYVIICKDEQGR